VDHDSASEHRENKAQGIGSVNKNYPKKRLLWYTPTPLGQAVLLPRVPLLEQTFAPQTVENGEFFIRITSTTSFSTQALVTPEDITFYLFFQLNVLPCLISYPP